MAQETKQDTTGNAGAKQAPRAWRKQCGGPNKDVCFLEQQVVANGRVVMVGSFGYKSQTEPVGVITVPLNIRLKAGLALKVDDKKEFLAQFDICSRQGCRVEVPLSAALTQDLRSGKFLNVGWRDANSKKQILRFNLDGFAAMWDSVATK
ncbi:MAG: invasion associated locus B family protein [Pseudomonadota bacterium]